MCCSGVSVLQYLKSLRAVIVLVLFTSLFNLFYGSGTVLVQWGVMQITDGGIKNAIFVAARILTMILVQLGSDLYHVAQSAVGRHGTADEAAFLH